MSKTTQPVLTSVDAVVPTQNAVPLTGERWGQDGMFTPEQLAKLTPEQLIAYACGTQIVCTVFPDDLVFSYDTIQNDQRKS